MKTLQQGSGSWFGTQMDYDPRKLAGTTTIHG